jgi:hypothetical protein
MHCRLCKWFEDANAYFEAQGQEETLRILEDESLASGPHEYGFCKRHAPRPHDGNNVSDVTWPLVYEREWCGEFAPKKEAADGTPNG